MNTLKEKLQLKNGEIIEVYDFQPITKNLIKVDLHIENKNHEGIWAVVSDEYKKIHDDDKSSNWGFASLRNDALAFYPNSSWGLIIPIKFRGKDRPECDLNWIVSDSEMIYNDKETKDLKSSKITNKLTTKKEKQ